MTKVLKNETLSLNIIRELWIIKYKALKTKALPPLHTHTHTHARTHTQHTHTTHTHNTTQTYAHNTNICTQHTHIRTQHTHTHTHTQTDFTVVTGRGWSAVTGNLECVKPTKCSEWLQPHWLWEDLYDEKCDFPCCGFICSKWLESSAPLWVGM